MAWFRRKTQDPEQGSEGPRPLSERSLDPLLAMLWEPQGFHAEQYRGLRNSITTLNPQNAPRTLLVTSALEGEGKSTSITNLGLCLAELPNTRVCLLDSDLRAPVIHEILDLPLGPGLSEVLSGDASVREVIVPSGLDGLDVITAGQGVANPSETVASERMVEILHQLKSLYAYTLVDTPPALAVTDSSMLAPRADGVLVIVRLEKTARNEAKEAIQLLENLGGNVIGTFLTGAREEDRSYAYGRS